MANITDATNAYSSTMNQMSKSALNSGADDNGPAFGDILKNSIGTAIDMQHKSEKMSAAALTGKADMTDVLQAVTNAEMALNTVLAVRDKVVQAYKDVMSTPM